MLDNEPMNPSENSTPNPDGPDATATRRRRAPAKKAASPPGGPPMAVVAAGAEALVPSRRRVAKKAAAVPSMTAEKAAKTPKVAKSAKAQKHVGPEMATDLPATPKAAGKRAPRKAAKSAATAATTASPATGGSATTAADQSSGAGISGGEPASKTRRAIPTVLFQPPSAENAVPAHPERHAGHRRPSAIGDTAAGGTATGDESTQRAGATQSGDSADAAQHEGSGAPRRRRRGGRGRRGGQGEPREADTSQPTADGESVSLDGVADGANAGDAEAGQRPRTRDRSRGGRGSGSAAASNAAGDGEAAGDGPEREGHDTDQDGEGPSASSRRRRRRRSRSAGESDVHAPDDPPNTVVRIRAPRDHDDSAGGTSGVQGVKGSTRLEAKKQRRREGREQGRHGRRSLVITESEFLARRESVDRVMAVRQRGDRTQIGVLEDGILVEHFVSTASTNRMVGNVYLGRVQNVLSGMEAAFVDIGKGRNAVLYAGEVNFDTSGLDGGPRRIESALKAGQAVVVQVTKDPIGQKGARLTSQVSLPGRYLVYVPEGSMMGISRKLPDVERSRLKAILKKVTPDGAGVIVRTAAEGASEEDLTRDVARLAAQWEDIKKKSETANAPSLLYGEPDLTIRVIRDVFNEDFNQLVVQADSEWDMIEAYVGHVAPDLVSRLSHWTSEGDIFGNYRVDEQIAKALDRKVWLPSGGYLVIDRTEAMIVIDVNTGRFIGKGGNLEETVTKNNLEAAEEIVRQLRLRDIGGIIVIDFIDMVLEANRDLVLRRLLECLGRDRTKHQVAEVTSLGLVQMTRKRVGNGLLEAFSETCETCNGRGVIVHTDLIEQHAPKATPLPKPGPAKVAAARTGRGSRSRPASQPAAETPADGVPVDGIPVDGIPVDGIPVDGIPVDGIPVDGIPVDGIPVDGATSEGPNAGPPASSGASRSRRGGRRRGGSKAAAAATAAAPEPV
jgi:ribonuclease E